MDDPLDLINTYIVTNHNNEITAIVLNPVLQAIVLEYRDFIGNLNDLTTPETEDLVQAINSIQEQIDNFSFSGVQVYSGTDDPNDTPPLSYNVADFYKQLDGGGNTIALFQYNGTEWVNLTPAPTVEKTFALVVTEDNVIQDDRLIGLDTSSIGFPFAIQADNNNWTDFTDEEIFSGMSYNSTTGTITGFTVQAGKLVIITTL